MTRAGGSRGKGRHVVLWRHGRTAWNTENRFQGHLDVELDPTGLEQAERAARLLAGLPPAAILSSDLVRATETAAALARWTGLEVLRDPDLRETYGGTWQGHLGREIEAMDAARYRAWRVGRGRGPRRRGESRSQVADRAVAAVAARRSRSWARGDILVVVTHGGTARATIGRLLGLPWSTGTSSAGSRTLPGRCSRRRRAARGGSASTTPAPCREPVVGDDV